MEAGRMSTMLNSFFYISFLVNFIDCTDYCVNSTHCMMVSTSKTHIDSTVYASCTGASYFNLSNNKIASIENTSFETLWNIQILDLDNNNISTIESDALVIMRNLQYLYVAHNDLLELPIGFFKNKNNLIHVDLSYNQIRRIPLAVFNYTMKHIQAVILRHNMLAAFEPWAYFQQPIPLVDLRWNNISTFTNDYNWTYTTRSIYDKVSIISARHSLSSIKLQVDNNVQKLAERNSNYTLI